MPYRYPTIDDISHAAWLKRNFALNPKLFSGFIEELSEKVREFSGKTTRKDVKIGYYIAIGVIIGNLYNNYIKDENKYTIIDRSNDGYKKGEYNPIRIGIRSIRDVIDYLESDDCRYIEVRAGNYDHDNKLGYVTRIRPLKRLIEDIEDYIINCKNISCRVSLSITRNTLDNQLPYISVSDLFISFPLPSIRLKSSSGSFLSYDQTPETERMRDNLEAINTFIRDHHWIDILLTDDEFRGLTRRLRTEDEESGDEADLPSDIDLLFRRQLYRVFNNGTFTDGGRFYGGWWQGVPSTLRKRIVINWYPTAELDYSNMQIAMLYADAGLELEGDAYAIEGIPGSYRKLIKRTLLQIINAERRMRAPRHDELPEGWSWQELQEAIRERHRPIAGHFNSGIGVKLQRRDADVAEAVMLRMMEDGHLVLPIHDSFIVEDGYQNRLKEVMVEAYRSQLGKGISIDADPTWIESLPVEAFQLDKLGVRSLEDWLVEEEERPEYSGYVARREEFIGGKDHDWIRSHHVRF